MHTMLIQTSYFDLVCQGMENWYEFIDHCYIVILCSLYMIPFYFIYHFFSWSYFCLFDFLEHEGDIIMLSLLNMFDILKIRLVDLGNEFIKLWHKWRFCLLEFTCKDWNLKMQQIKHVMLIPPRYFKLHLWNNT